MRHQRAGIAVLCATGLSLGLLSFSSAQATPTVTVKDVQNAFQKVEAKSEHVNALTVQIKTTKSQIADLNADIARDKKKYQTQKDALSASIVSQQLDSPLGPTVSLLGSRSPQAFLDGLGAVQALNSSQSDALDKFSETSKELNNRRVQLKERIADLNKDQKAAKATQAEMRKKYQVAKSQLAQLSRPQQASFDSGETKVDFTVSASGRAKKAVDFAMAQLGDPYQWGGNGPNAWDCSGLTQHAMAAAGISIPRVVGPQYAASQHIPMSQLQPGDLVFYASMAHVGIYIGNGKVIHAPRPGKTVEVTGLSGFSLAGRFG